jgi:hypothetical protein
MEDNLKWKTNSNGRRPPMEDDLQWKTTSNGRQPPMEDDLQWKKTSNGRQPPKEDDLQWKMTSNGISQQLLYGSCLMSSQGEIRGKVRGNLECGSAQLSLFHIIVHRPPT